MIIITIIGLSCIIIIIIYTVDDNDGIMIISPIHRIIIINHLFLINLDNMVIILRFYWMTIGESIIYTWLLKHVMSATMLINQVTLRP